MKEEKLTERLEQLERRVESLEFHISARLWKLEEELIRLKERVARIPAAESPSDLLEEIREASHALQVLGAARDKRGG